MTRRIPLAIAGMGMMEIMVRTQTPDGKLHRERLLLSAFEWRSNVTGWGEEVTSMVNRAAEVGRRAELQEIRERDGE